MSKLIAFTKPVNLLEASVKKWRGLKAYFLRKQKAMKHFRFANLIKWSQKFNPSQLCYFVAAAYMLLTAIFSDLSESDILLIGAIAFFGLFREMWKMFQGIWEHNIGKAIILIVYASTTNFALAFAAVKINAITGIEPGPFVFTLGFTTLVMLPFWIVLSNVFFLLIGLILANLLLFISVPFKLIGVRLPVHWEDKHRAGTTMLLRIILIPIVIFSLFSFTAPYFSQFELSDGLVVVKMDENAKEVDELVKSTDQEQLLPKDTETQLPTPVLDTQAQEEVDKVTNQPDTREAIPTEPSVNEALDAVREAFSGSSIEDNEESETTEDNRSKFINKMIANFIYYFESYKYSKCKKDANQHSVHIDEDLVLLISEDDSAVYGYRYEVAECIPASPL